MLKEKQNYRELGLDYLDKLNVAKSKEYHCKRLKELGFDIVLKKAA